MKRISVILMLLFITRVGLGQVLFSEDKDSKKMGAGLRQKVLLGDIVINEFMAGNDTTLQDPQGQWDDWLELYNRTGQAISLEGMYLTDDPDTLKWPFPDISIAANSYLLIWVDDDEEDSPGLHAGFNMDKDGEYIGLYDTDAKGNAVIDSLSFGLQMDDVSMGRYPDGEGDFIFMWIPTPGTENVFSTDDVKTGADSPEAFHLFQNYPNPFNGQTVLPYVIDRTGNIHLSIISTTGRIIRILVNEIQDPGNYTVIWDGRDTRGNIVASGIYLYRIHMKDATRTRKMLLVQ